LENDTDHIIGIDYNSKTWFHIKQLLLMYQENSIYRICGDLPQNDTDRQRGCILAYKTMLGLEQTARELLAQANKG
jgi:hypothetical protein